MLLLLLALAARADPCASELLVGRAPLLEGDAALSGGEAVLTLRYRRLKVDGLPFTALREARLEGAWTVSGAPARVAMPLAVDPERSSRWWPATEPPTGWEADWTFCERGGPRDTPPSELVGVAWKEPTGALAVRVRHIQPDACRLRFDLDGPWAQGATFRLRVEERGPRPPEPLALPDRARQEAGSWVWTDPSGDMVIDVPGCG